MCEGVEDIFRQKLLVWYIQGNHEEKFYLQGNDITEKKISLGKISKDCAEFE